MHTWIHIYMDRFVDAVLVNLREAESQITKCKTVYMDLQRELWDANLELELMKEYQREWTDFFKYHSLSVSVCIVHMYVVGIIPWSQHHHRISHPPKKHRQMKEGRRRL